MRGAAITVVVFAAAVARPAGPSCHRIYIV
jgi:hypothetical protein